jgi:nucleoside permease NupC
MALQLIFGLIVLRWDFGRRAFECLGSKFSLLLDYSVAGSEFVYGYLANDENASGITLGTIFAFRVKSICFDFLFGILFHLVFIEIRFCRSSTFSVF